VKGHEGRALEAGFVAGGEKASESESQEGLYFLVVGSLAIGSKDSRGEQSPVVGALISFLLSG
jgi:hypothetical protein